MDIVTTKLLHGRREITTSTEEINRDNVTRVLRDAYVKHLANRTDIEYLYNYYKGKQPVLSREKEVRPEICNRVVENRANAIVTFRVGYTVGKPIQYVSSVSDKKVSDQIAKLNDLMRMAGKARKDKRLVEWQMICGTGYRIVLPAKDKKAKVQFNLQTLDPRNSFVINRNDIDHTQLAGVYYTVSDEQEETFHVYADDGMYYRIRGWQSGVVEAVETYPLSHIPIVEYPLNDARLGAFEIVLPLLDELNNLESNRMDAVEQFVQSLLIATNCDFEDGVTANTIREAGMVVLKSIGDNKADIKVISETLNQDQTQTLKQDILDAINQIVGMPSQGNGSTGDSSNNGAVILKNGWQGAETRAQDFENMFSEPEQRTLELVTEICGTLGDLKLDASNVEPKFTRRNYEDLLSKSQTLVTMLGQDKIHPQCAYEACGLFVDTQDAYNMGMEWYEEQQKKAQELAEKNAAADAAASGGSDEEDASKDKGSSEGEKGDVNRQGTYIRGYWQKREDRK